MLLSENSFIRTLLSSINSNTEYFIASEQNERGFLNRMIWIDMNICDRFKLSLEMKKIVANRIKH